jgi:hypothetical protein
MSQITWITPAGSLGKVAEEEYFEYQLDAYSTQGSQLVFTVIAGKLSPGLQLFKSGLIQGIPVLENANPLQDEYLQTFTVRATDIRGKICDRTFTIIINSIALPQIIPKNISIGTFYDGYYLDYQLIAVDPNPVAELQWKVIDGELPLGSTLSSSGLLSGFLEPFISTAAEGTLGWNQTGWDQISWDMPTAQAQTRTYRFTVQVFDGARYDNSNYTITVQAKSLFTVDNTEILSGTSLITTDIDTHHTPFITTPPQSIPVQRQNTNFAFKIDGIDLDASELFYDIVPMNVISLNEFVEITPGVFVTQSVIGQGYDQGPNEGYSPGDYPDQPGLPAYPGYPNAPIITFDSYGFDQVDQSLPPGLSIDNTTGWITGKLGTQVEESKTYEFNVYCYKIVTAPRWVASANSGLGAWVNVTETYYSRIVTFSLTVVGDRNNSISWSTPSDLGYITNGDISEIAISAVSKLGKTLNYRLKEGSRSNNVIYPTGPGPGQVQIGSEVVVYTPQARNRLPQGLTLTHDGLIVGRTTFQYFSLDRGVTTFDKNVTDFDNLYEFTVTASDDDYDPDLTDEVFINQLNNATVSSDKTFIIKVKTYNIKPYENIYLKALTNKKQRNDFKSLISNTDIFPNELIYRINDPWFGKAPDIKFLFAAGLNPSTASTYVESMQNNHYNKRVDLGNIKTAIALDANFNVKYEVIYIEVTDELTEAGKSTSTVINRTGQLGSPYNAMSEYQVVYPNSFANMNKELSSIGFAHKGALPDWMINPQEDGRVLGFTRGVILAYTIPGASKLIAYRLKQSKNTFNELDFVADRYQLDHTLSKNFSITEQAFNSSLETTFDRLAPSGELFPYVGSVSFAVTIPFDEINGRHVEYLRTVGGLDGSMDIRNGQTLIFAKQEGFVTEVHEFATVREPLDSTGFDSVGLNLGYVPRQYTSPNDGWNMESGLFGTSTYGESYALSEPVPTVQRHGIWEVQISEDQIITLVYVKDVLYNQYVHVIAGTSYRETKLYYDPIVHAGHTVPTYSVLSAHINVSSEVTKFDGNGTKFYNNRDNFVQPEVGDIYLKFPKSNAYH